MYLFAFFCVLLITSATTGHGFSSAPNCSSVLALSDKVPVILLNLKNPTNDVLLGRAFIVRKMSPKPRKFEITCMAPYPINLEFNSELKNLDHKDLTTETEYDKASGIFKITAFIFVGPEQEFFLNTSCIPDCESSRFSSGIRFFTLTASNNWQKLLVQNIPLQTGGKVRRNYETHKVFAYNTSTLGACVGWTVVVAFVVFSWNYISSRRSQQPEQIELDIIHL